MKPIFALACLLAVFAFGQGVYYGGHGVGLGHRGHGGYGLISLGVRSSYGHGYGSGYGSGYGYGRGYGYGYGRGYGYGAVLRGPGYGYGYGAVLRGPGYGLARPWGYGGKYLG